MRKIVTLSAVAFLSTMAFADADTQKQIDELKKKIEQLEKANKAQDVKISKVNAQSAMDNIKFDVDFRTSYDNLRYETANGAHYSNSSLYSNRLWLGMGYAPTENMMFKGQLSVNKAFGANYNQRGAGFDMFDWVLNENLTDDTIKLREAYWLWSFDTGKIGWTVSAGRRPATNGYLVNLRDDDQAKSPMGHIINMEFDGASAAMKLDKYISGMYFKLCLGRGLTNANSRFDNTGYDFATDDSDLDNTDMVGMIFQPYDNGQYSVMTKWYRGFNVPGYKADFSGLESFGDMDGMAISFKTDGIGDGINDFLDETVLFASFAASTTRPNAGQPMLGSTDDETGTSFWVGTQMPNLTGGKFGLEYNHGSKYWRPFTYGEDTMIGSKMAVRGNAYEAYWTQPLIKDVFSMQIRYTYLDYDYTGSNAFFGYGGTPMKISEAATPTAVETAQDLRVYFRYRY
ncbi:MAG: DUF3373 family protein [Sulfurimonas sp.]|uniref:DUF3373 family protein n=1 Tax=Sulfurimonas sp. TaxID=2022749 RepID=UPI002620CBAC|nr:DUF3373 family protein [Sulfurimonas sp.]MDD2651955.1 DUF3373 family protein [Sulfurimonas sp.]MDD3451919.1 DUF3373 family protein [Sulfurimonas sp.]